MEQKIHESPLNVLLPMDCHMLEYRYSRYMCLDAFRLLSHFPLAALHSHLQLVISLYSLLQRCAGPQLSFNVWMIYRVKARACAPAYQHTRCMAAPQLIVQVLGMGGAHPVRRYGDAWHFVYHGALPKPPWLVWHPVPVAGRETHT